MLSVFRSYPEIRAQLLAEGLVSAARAGQIDAILASGAKSGRANILENIADPFVWSMGSLNLTLTVLDQGDFMYTRERMYIRLTRPIHFAHAGGISGNYSAPISPHCQR